MFFIGEENFKTNFTQNFVSEFRMLIFFLQNTNTPLDRNLKKNLIMSDYLMKKKYDYEKKFFILNSIKIFSLTLGQPSINWDIETKLSTNCISNVISHLKMFEIGS